MRTITIYGASDDLVEISGCPGADEFDLTSACVRGWPWMGAWDFVSEDGSLRVHAIYGGGSATWCFAVGQVDEDVPLPRWHTRTERGTRETCPYSTVLTIEAPDDVVCSRVEGAE